ncbi:helix-turn-helix transcriptional regulator [Alcaligenaceae bacterium]|nr:helix-turn-helix transcriptional regulator [Alcaligenaceae bacterium]
MHPTILETNGKPAFVVLPYDEYLAITSGKPVAKARVPADDSVPHEVVRMQVKNNWSLIRAWREYLGITQAEMASRLDIRQPSYAAMEAVDAKPKKITRERIAAALEISLEQASL